MVRKILYIAILTAIILVACQSTSADSTASLTGESSPEQPEQATPSVEPSRTPEPSPTTTAEPPVIQADANCTVVSMQPTPGPTEESLFPPVSDTDWVKGAENASVTIIEYSDFQ